LEALYLKFMPDGRIVRVIEGVAKQETEIDPSDLINLIPGSLDHKVKDWYHSLALPKGCIYYGVVERHSGAEETVVVIEKERCIWFYNHMGETYYVGYPKLLFAYKIQGDRITNSALVAATDKYIKNSSEVYHFPYANVFSNTHICQGSMRYPTVKSLADIARYPLGFYLVEHTHANNGAHQPVLEILEKVRNKPFDDSLLTFITTFEKWVTKFANIPRDDQNNQPAPMQALAV